LLGFLRQLWHGDHFGRLLDIKVFMNGAAKAIVYQKSNQREKRMLISIPSA
jgi:hypothetical protein